MLKFQHVRQRHIPFNSSLTHLPLPMPSTKKLFKKIRNEHTTSPYSLYWFPYFDYWPYQFPVGMGVISDSSVHIQLLLFLCNLSQFNSLFYNLPLTLRKACTFSSLHKYNSSIITFYQEALFPLFHPINYCQVHLLNTTLNMSLPIQKTFNDSFMTTGGHSKSFRI